MITNYIIYLLKLLININSRNLIDYCRPLLLLFMVSCVCKYPIIHASAHSLGTSIKKLKGEKEPILPLTDLL